MRTALLALMLLTVGARAAQAVPVNPGDVQGVAAIMAIDPVDNRGNLFVLTTAGQVWMFLNGDWSRTGWGYNEGELDLPVPVGEVTEWWLWGFRTSAGAFWYFQVQVPQGWQQSLPPPFAPVVTQQKSLGSVKSTYR